MRLLKIGSRGQAVKELQQLLAQRGYNLAVDGVFGPNTETLVKDFQKKVGLTADGLVGNMTWTALKNQPVTTYPDFQFSGNIDSYPLATDQYYKEIHKKDTIYLHHTAGGPRPDWVIDWWNNDSQGRVATAFVIGGKTTQGDYNGRIFQAVEPRYWAHHLGLRKSNNRLLNSKSIAIEICNYGGLKKNDRGEFVTYVNSVLPASEVYDLGFTWRGFRFFQKYTDEQLESCRKLIIELKEQFDIPLNLDNITKDWFEINQDALDGKPGLYTHIHVRKDKIDCAPQPELIDMLNSL